MEPKETMVGVSVTAASGQMTAQGYRCPYRQMTGWWPRGETLNSLRAGGESATVAMASCVVGSCQVEVRRSCHTETAHRSRDERRAGKRMEKSQGWEDVLGPC